MFISANAAVLEDVHALDIACGHGDVALLRYDNLGRLIFASRAAAIGLGYTDVAALSRDAGTIDTLFPGHSIVDVRQRGADGMLLFADRWNVRAADRTALQISVLFLPCHRGWACLLAGAAELLKLREDESRFRVMLDALLGGVFLTDGEYFRYVNRGFAEMVGSEPAELVGTPCALRFAPETLQWLENHTMSGASADPDRIHHAELITHDGSGRREVLLRIHATRYFGEALFIVSTYDVTEIRRSDRALQDYARHLRILSQRVLEVQENERRNLARELHDEIGQQLTMIKLSLARLLDGDGRMHVPEVLDMVSSLMQQVRDLSLDLRPSMLDDLGLAPALRWYSDRVARLAALQADICIDAGFPRLRTDVETLYFRIAQEAITNIMRHAHADGLHLRLTVNEQDVVLCIADDGRGFDLESARQQALRGGSAGLLGMQERAALGGAVLQLDSSPGKGTVLRLSLPKSQALEEKPVILFD